MWLSTTAQSALRAVLYLAERDDPGPVRVDDIATDLDLPRNYLSKTLHALTRAGVLASSRGPKGGFQLALEPGDLLLARIVGPFQPAEERRCLVGRPTCGDADPCPAHHHWARLASAVESFFATTSVADLLRHPQAAFPGSPFPDPPQEE